MEKTIWSWQGKFGADHECPICGENLKQQKLKFEKILRSTKTNKISRISKISCNPCSMSKLLEYYGYPS
jgi:hypothetical protein